MTPRAAAAAEALRIKTAQADFERRQFQAYQLTPIGSSSSPAKPVVKRKPLPRYDPLAQVKSSPIKNKSNFFASRHRREQIADIGYSSLELKGIDPNKADFDTTVAAVAER